MTTGENPKKCTFRKKIMISWNEEQLRQKYVVVFRHS